MTPSKFNPDLHSDNSLLRSELDVSAGNISLRSAVITGRRVPSGAILQNLPNNVRVRTKFTSKKL